jgi:hypothetical protein
VRTRSETFATRVALRTPVKLARFSRRGKVRRPSRLTWVAATRLRLCRRGPLRDVDLRSFKVAFVPTATKIGTNIAQMTHIGGERHFNADLPYQKCVVAFLPAREKKAPCFRATKNMPSCCDWDILKRPPRLIREVPRAHRKSPDC